MSNNLNLNNNEVSIENLIPQNKHFNLLLNRKKIKIIDFKYFFILLIIFILLIFSNIIISLVFKYYIKTEKYIQNINTNLKYIYENQNLMNEELNYKRIINNIERTSIVWPLPKEIKFKPWMTLKELKAFCYFMKSDNIYFEFGAGGSTNIASYYKVKTYSVESDVNWHKKLKENNIIANYITVDLKANSIGFPGKETNVEDWKKYIQAYKSEYNANIIFIDGRFRVACSLDTSFYLIIVMQQIYNFIKILYLNIKSVINFFSFIIIKYIYLLYNFIVHIIKVIQKNFNLTYSNNQVEYVIFSKIKNDTIVLIHDYTNRYKYHIIENYYIKIKTWDRLAAFIKRPDVNFIPKKIYNKYLKVKI